MSKRRLFAELARNPALQVVGALSLAGGGAYMAHENVHIEMDNAPAEQTVKTEKYKKQLAELDRLSKPVAKMQKVRKSFNYQNKKNGWTDQKRKSYNDKYVKIGANYLRKSKMLAIQLAIDPTINEREYKQFAQAWEDQGVYTKLKTVPRVSYAHMLDESRAEFQDNVALNNWSKGEAILTAASNMDSEGFAIFLGIVFGLGAGALGAWGANSSSTVYRWSKHEKKKPALQ